MACVVKDNSDGDYERMNIGLHQAVCCNVIDVGLQNTPWGNKRKIVICFEFKEKMQDGRPFMLSREFTASLNKKSNLSKILEGWRGREFVDKEREGFDLEKIVGVNCMINLIEKKKDDNVYTNIDTLMPLMKNIEPLKQTIERTDVPDWIQDKIQAGINNEKLSPEYPEQSPQDERRDNSSEKLFTADDPDLPF